MNTTLVMLRAFGRQPLAVLGKLTMAALIGMALMLMGTLIVVP
jgi:hypothetical protein